MDTSCLALVTDDHRTSARTAGQRAHGGVVDRYNDRCLAAGLDATFLMAHARFLSRELTPRQDHHQRQGERPMDTRITIRDGGPYRPVSASPQPSPCYVTAVCATSLPSARGGNGSAGRCGP